MRTELEKFKSHVDAAHGIYYRMDKGLLTGRNANSTDIALSNHVAAARKIQKLVLDDETNDLWSYLDSHPRYAAKWDAIERRFFGVRV